MKWHDPNEIRDNALRVASAPAGAHLTYYGGRVNSGTQVVQVLWGTGSYASYVSGTGTPSMGTFYQQLLASTNYSSWLDSEYNTVNPSGTKTNQHIAAGRFVSQVSITPSVTGTVDDSQIQTELKNQIAAGHLPAPTVDAQGNATTYYAIFFPHGTTITQGGSNSCQAGGFCAYHGTVAASSSQREFYYGVHPDMQSGSGCDSGCGSSSSAFGNQTSVASHELTEMITDAEVGLATTNGPPLAWYDNTNGEIGDICNAQQGTFTACDGQTYTIQLEFSNAQSNCINGIQKSCGSGGSDFTISDNPASLSVQTGSSGTFTVSTAAVGTAGTVSLAVSGAPSGVTATVSPTSVTAGQSATVTVNVASSAAVGSYTLTVTGTEGTTTHSANETLNVTTTTPPPPGGITNGDFETGSLSGWTSAGTATNVASGCHGGSHCAQVGSTSPSTDSSIAQTFTAPTGTTGISFWYKIVCPDTITYDWASATLKDNTAGTTATLLANTCTNGGAWVQATGAVTAGHSYTLTLANHDDNYAGDATYTFYDDVVLTSSAPPPSGITNGGFETGSLSGWTSSGAHDAVTTSGAHTGSYAAMLGNTTPTNGDSTIAQTFTVPSGKTSLAFVYEMTCPDTVTYDWFTATLKDNTTGTTTTIVAKTCATSTSYVAKSAAVTAGHSYTLTLTSHDDNYAGDPTYTKVDDVTLN